MNAARIGMRRGWIEFKQTLTTPQDVFAMIFPSAILLTVMVFMKGSTIGNTGFSLGAATLPSSLGMSVAFAGMTTVMQQLAVEREDGTLLRAKATPNGMLTYLIGKIASVSMGAVLGVLLLLIPGAFLFDGLELGSVGAWVTLAWVLAFGLVASLPIGAVLGSLFSNPRSVGVMMLPIMGLVAISGIFYPLAEADAWMRDIAQVFPIYWLGLGMRSALLPDNLAAVEIGGSWRHLETIGVLGVWAIVGIVVAPIVLRRMARRESGSAMTERREKAMQRIT
ncbi:ABC transporter permease [Actinocrispum wychmicini]|uniref:ABC-2 type transport system permease protein n=1 Tax=Actinocrispum wychmicini TaxID=1213861 RepID=A0A4R2J732_9PSEU|nr:ABC transporter permease [Actinocrispum wychmicini]TCO52376.1 ABC-2 type transport system permease protein [Actinocrispum wychmicini]